MSSALTTSDGCRRPHRRPPARRFRFGARTPSTTWTRAWTCHQRRRLPARWVSSATQPSRLRTSSARPSRSDQSATTRQTPDPAASEVLARSRWSGRTYNPGRRRRQGVRATGEQVHGRARVCYASDVRHARRSPRRTLSGGASVVDGPRITVTHTWRAGIYCCARRLVAHRRLCRACHAAGGGCVRHAQDAAQPRRLVQHGVQHTPMRNQRRFTNTVNRLGCLVRLRMVLEVASQGESARERAAAGLGSRSDERSRGDV